MIVQYRYGGVDMIDNDKLYGLLPNYIPDYCLQPNNDDSASHHWHSLIIEAYQKVCLFLYSKVLTFTYLKN